MQWRTMKEDVLFLNGMMVAVYLTLLFAGLVLSVLVVLEFVVFRGSTSLLQGMRREMYQCRKSSKLGQDTWEDDPVDHASWAQMNLRNEVFLQRNGAFLRETMQSHVELACGKAQ